MLFLRKCLINGYATLWSLDYHCMLSGSLFISFSFYGVGDWTHGPMHARQMLCCWAHLGMEKLFLHYALISEEVSKMVISDSGLCLLGKFVTKVTMWHLGSHVRLWAAASAFVLASVLWGVGARVCESDRMRQLIQCRWFRHFLTLCTAHYQVGHCFLGLSV